MDGLGQVVAKFGWAQIIGVLLIAAFFFYCIFGTNKRGGSSNSNSSPTGIAPPSDQNTNDTSGTGGV